MIDFSKPFKHFKAGDTVSVYIPETPLLQRDEFGEYSIEQFKADHPVGQHGSMQNDVYDEEEVIFSQGFCFKIKYLKHLPLPATDSLVFVIPDCKIEVDFMTNKKYYKKEIFINQVCVSVGASGNTCADLQTTKDGCGYCYSIQCDFSVGDIHIPL
jgi:hypothetical protein